MPNEAGQAYALRLQETLKRIPGVMRAGVILDPQNEISEIHLVGLPSRKPKQIVRDAESLLYVQFGVRVDYRKISLVQVAPENQTEAPVRLRFIAAQPHPKRQGYLQVVLKQGETWHEGAAPFPVGGEEQAEARAAALATLAAVQPLHDSLIRLAVQDVQLVAMRENSVCVVIVVAAMAQAEERLTGACLVSGSLLEAAAKATLDAINRRLELWVTQGTAHVVD